TPTNGLLPPAQNWSSHRSSRSPDIRPRIWFLSRGLFRKILLFWRNFTLASELPRCWSGSSIVMGDAVNRFNTAFLYLERAKPIRKTYKSLLPTYDVFDEDRYFEPAAHVEPFEAHGRKIGVTICEDIWTDDYLPR